MENFSHCAWHRNSMTYEKILTMPFNKELMEGTLAQSRFKHYMIQDAHYLEGFARALSLTSAKGQNAEHIVHFASAAQTAIVVERSLHSDFFIKFNINTEDFEATEPTPVCEHYVSYLLRIAALEPFEVVLAALLPCFWIYREVGKHIHGRAATGNSYQAWIDTYAGVEFIEAVDEVIAVVDDVAAHVSPRTMEAMHRAFTRAIKLEWMFWDSSYREESWLI